MRSHRSLGGRRSLLAALSLLALLAVASTALSTPSTFRGNNGRLLYQAQIGANTQLFTIKPDGTGVAQITHFKGRSATDANWEPGGSRIVFTQHWDPGGSSEHFLLSTINANGSGSRRHYRRREASRSVPTGSRAVGSSSSTPQGRTVGV